MHAIVLRYFSEVARCGSIRQAAKELYVASSAINRHILRLEEELGTPLFDRLPNGMRLNPAGERLLQHIRTTIHGFNLVRTELDALKGDRHGHVSLAAMDSLFIDLLPAAIDEFSELYPAVTYSVNAMPPTEVPESVASGAYDIGITFTTRIPAALSVVGSVHFPLGVVMAPFHQLAKQTSLSLTDCHGHAILRSGGRTPIHSGIAPAFSKFWEAITPSVVCNWTPMLKRLIVAGKGIGFFTKIAFLEDIARGDVVWRPLDMPDINEIQVGIVIPNQRALSHVTLAFVERLTRRLKQAEVASIIQ